MSTLPDFVPRSETNSLAVKQVGKWAVYISNGLDVITPEEIAIWDYVHREIRLLYALNSDLIMGDLIESGLFFFETESEMDRFFQIFSSPLTDSSAIYACTYNPSGECLDENT